MMLSQVPTLAIILDPTTLSGICLWSLTLYLSLTSIREGVTAKLEQGLYRIGGFPLTDEDQKNLTSPENAMPFGRSEAIAIFASLLSIIPFFVIGFFCNYGLEISLGRSWAISTGILACISCGVYELGRHSS